MSEERSEHKDPAEAEPSPEGYAHIDEEFFKQYLTDEETYGTMLRAQRRYLWMLVLGVVVVLSGLGYFFHHFATREEDSYSRFLKRGEAKKVHGDKPEAIAYGVYVKTGRDTQRADPRIVDYSVDLPAVETNGLSNKKRQPPTNAKKKQSVTLSRKELAKINLDDEEDISKVSYYEKTVRPLRKGEGADRETDNGQLSRRAISQILRRHRLRLRRCSKYASGAGTLSLSISFKVKPNGRVAQVAVTTQGTGEQKVETCLVRVLRSLKFPPSPRGAEFQQKLIFQ